MAVLGSSLPERSVSPIVPTFSRYDSQRKERSLFFNHNANRSIYLKEYLNFSPSIEDPEVAEY